MKNAFKVTTTLAALLLTSGLAVEMLSAVHTNRPLQVSTGKAYVSNAAPGTTTIVVTIIDDARDTDDTAATQTIPAAGLIVTNITTDPATNTLAIGASATEIAFGVWTAAVTINTAGTTSTNNGIFANGGDHIQITYTTVFFTLTNARAPFTDLPYVIVDAEGPTVENNTPPYSFSSTTQRQLLQAEVVDAVSGMGSSQSEVAGNAAVIVDGTPFVPAVADLGGGRWLASAEVILSAGSHSWTVAARDVLGNVTGGPMPTQGIAATLDKDYVGNAAPGTTTIVVTIDDGARDTDSTAGTDSIPAADLVVTNLTTESATNTLQIGTSATESAVGVWSAIITVNTTGTTPTNNGIFANGGDHIQVTYTDAAGVTIIIRTPNLSNPYVVVDAQGPTVENNSPPYSFTTTTQRQLPQAEVFDAASGMGSSRSEVAGNVAVIVDGTAFVPAVADLGSGRWLVAVEVVLSAGSHTWSVAARDVLGNVTGGPMPAQAIAATLDKDYVGNASPATTTLVVTIDDPSRAGAGTLPASALVVDNITTAITTDMIEIGTLATEIGSTGVFTAVVSVDPSTTNSAAPLIAAVHGDQVQALYTTVGAVTVAALTPSGDTAAVVDALGPIITNMLPVDGASTNDSSPTLQADISDTGAGVGTIKSEVQSNSIILVDAAGNLPLATDLGGGVWRISFTPALFAGFHTWQVRVSDALGNVTNSSVLNLAIDFNAPAFVSGITGDTLDALNNVVVAANDRRAIHVVFNEELDGTSVATDGSDFRVQLYLGGPVLAVAGAELGAVPLHQDVFITMVDELPVGAVPIVTIVGIVSDEAGNFNLAGENVNASDGVTSGLARIHRRTPMDGVRKAEGGGGGGGGGVRELQGK